MTEKEIMTKENSKATTPNALSEVVIPVKFNKEIKNLTVEEASLLAQKGMKFDLIKDDFEKIKLISSKEGKSVSAFLSELEGKILDDKRKMLLEKCSGDEELVNRIITLENGAFTDTKGFDEVKKYFPNIKDEASLPESVVEASKLKGTFLLDEYLRYLLTQKKRQEKSIRFQEKAESLSIGAMSNQKGTLSPESEDFIKGLWK